MPSPLLPSLPLISQTRKMQTTSFLRTLYRTLQISVKNRSLTTPSPLLSLPTDILLLILDNLPLSFINIYLRYKRDERGPTPLKALSLTNSYFRKLVQPYIFRRIYLGSPRAWTLKEIRRAILSISNSKCQRALREFTREVHVGDWLPPSSRWMSAAFRKACRELVTLLARTLIRLERIHVDGNDYEHPFRQDDIQLPSAVKEVVLGPYTEWLIPMCPNVQSGSSTEGFKNEYWHHLNLETEFIQRAASAPKLEHFALHSRWKVDTLLLILEKMPKLRRLHLAGDEYISNQERLFAIFPHFQFLERLDLPSATNLARWMQWDRGSSTMQRGREVYMVGNEVTAEQVRMFQGVFDNTVTLREVRFGDTCRALGVEREGDGRKVKLRWEVRGGEDKDWKEVCCREGDYVEEEMSEDDEVRLLLAELEM